ncbi:MAG: AAA family ATPase [Schlesneria sp.]
MNNPLNEKTTNGSTSKSKPLKSKTTSFGVKREKNRSVVAQPLYFRSLIVRNVRCFGDEPQTLNLTTPDGKQWAKWTIILGNNGTGKSTLLQLLDCILIQTDFPSGVREPSDTVTFLSFDEPGRRGGSSFPRVFTDDEKRQFPRLDTSLSKRRSFAQFEFFIAIPESHVADNIQTQLTQVGISWSYNIWTTEFDSFPRHSIEMQRAGYGAWRRLGRTTLSPSLSQNENRASHLFDESVELINAEEWLQQLDYSASKKSKISGNLSEQFELVRTTLLNLLPDIQDIRIAVPTEEHPFPRVLFSTAFGNVRLNQLGFGYQSLISWVVDFAARLFKAYPHSPNPLAEPAVCLVDEIDLHLHPSWQRKVMSYLSERFPNTQFIATAHSPLIVQAAPEIGANVVVLHRDGDHVVISNNPIDINGWRADQILSSELFDDQPLRSPQIQAAIDERVSLKSKPKLTASDKRRLKELDAIVDTLPVGTTPEERDVAKQLKEAAALLDRVTSGMP